jgi:hypothetical protein
MKMHKNLKPLKEGDHRAISIETYLTNLEK